MIINGITEANIIKDSLHNFVNIQKIEPKLAIIQVGSNPASEIYINFKQQRAEEIGIKTSLTKFENTITTKELISAINSYNNDKSINGIIVQMPLPEHIDKEKIICAVSPEKDVDGFHPENFGKLSLGVDGMISCTPMGCLHLIKTVTKNISGLNAVIIGRSFIVGRPMALLLLNNNADVTILHSHTKDITSYTKNADIIIACAGKQKLITKDMVNPNTIIIDVGVTKTENGKIMGDSDFENLKDYVKAITPPIGGVGPMTIAMLLYNTTKAYCLQNNVAEFAQVLKS